MKFCQNCEILSKLGNFVENMLSEHCVWHCMLMMVCGIVLGKAKTTKVGMVWYELNIVNKGSLQKKNRHFLGKSPKLWVGGGQES